MGNPRRGSKVLVTLVVGILCWMVGFTSSFAEDLCQGLDDPDFFRIRALNLDNRIAFDNPLNGAFNLPIGLCWWHSRLQRSLIYLAQTRPLDDNEKPMNSWEIRAALLDLILERKVVTLRGYDSIYDFTFKNHKLILQTLRWWQAVEAANLPAGMQGLPAVAPQQLEALMRELYEEVEGNKVIAYQMLQFPGFTAHAWLVQRVVPIFEGHTWKGFELYVIDSTFPLQTQKYTYYLGQTHFMGTSGPFTPYLQRRGSIKRYRTALEKHCSPKPRDFAIFGDRDSTRARRER